jgi:hypothetical protein
MTDIMPSLYTLDRDFSTDGLATIWRLREAENF